MELRTDETERGVRERRWGLHREGETVPAVVWTPDGAEGPRPKVLFGHGGLQDKTAPNIVALARALVRHLGYACVAIDAPGHGERVTVEQRDRARRRALDGDGTVPRYRGETTDPYMPYFMRGVRDWTAVLDAVERLPEVGTGPTGWWGVSMGTSIGLPFVATEPRITCAVLGLASTVPRPGYDEYLGWARSLTMPAVVPVPARRRRAPRRAGDGAVRPVRLEREDDARQPRTARRRPDGSSASSPSASSLATSARGRPAPPRPGDPPGAAQADRARHPARTAAAAASGSSTPVSTSAS